VQRKSIFKDLLASILVVLRWLLWVAIGANIAIEIAEVYLQKDVYHLAISAIFFLLANMQIGISRLLISMDDEEMSRRFFYLSIVMLCAAVIAVFDMGIDRILAEMASSQFVFSYKLLSIAEFFLGSISTLLAGYSLDRFFVLIRRKVVDLVDVKL
jgi:hypothetical protein